MITWPGQIAPERQTNSIINFTDIFATLGELLQIDLAEAYPSSAADSHSFLPVLLDSAKQSLRRAMPFMKCFQEVRSQSTLHFILITKGGITITLLLQMPAIIFS